MSNNKEKLFKEFFTILDQWLTLYEENDDLIEKELLSKKYRTIGIYGMGTMGYHLVQSLKNSEISIKYIIDDEHRQYCNGIKTVTISDNLTDIEAFIYTNPFENREVLESIERQYKAPVIYLGDLLFGNI